MSYNYKHIMQYDLTYNDIDGNNNNNLLSTIISNNSNGNINNTQSNSNNKNNKISNDTPTTLTTNMTNATTTANTSIITSTSLPSDFIQSLSKIAYKLMYYFHFIVYVVNNMILLSYTLIIVYLYQIINLLNLKSSKMTLNNGCNSWCTGVWINIKKKKKTQKITKQKLHISCKLWSIYMFKYLCPLCV